MPLECLHSSGISFTIGALGFCVKETDVSEANQTPKSLKAQITRTSLVLAAAALLREQQGGRAAIKALPESDARIASAGEQLAQLVGKGEPTLARITVAAGLLGDLARLRTTGVLV